MKRIDYRHAVGAGQGFTLIELLVVLVVLGLLAGLVGPQVMKHLGESKVKTAKLQIEEISAALDMFRIDVDRYPTDDEKLAALVQQPSGVDSWNGPYLRKSFVPKDPWGREYLYRYPGENGEFDVYSLGADQQEGGSGENSDIVSWK